MNKPKLKLLVLFLFVGLNAIAQIPEEKKLQLAYIIGTEAFNSIQTLDRAEIRSYFSDDVDLSYIVNGIETKKFHEDSIRIIEDLLYNQDSKKFEFVIYGGTPIPSNDKWGFFKYSFVLSFEIELKEGRAFEISNTKILKGSNSAGLKLWWRSHLETYRSQKYARKEIADKYKLIPPPPPPPASKSWL